MITGADLVTRLRRRAQELGQPVSRFAAPLSHNVQSWLKQTERAAAPKPHTIARVEALIAGQPVAPPPPKNFQTSPRSALGPRRESLRHYSRESRIDNPPEPVDRDPCFWCGIRADLGCSHRRPS